MPIMKIEDANAIFLLEYCAEECAGYQKDDACENCEINAAIKALDKQIPFTPETNNLKVGLGRCKCGAEFLEVYKNCADFVDRAEEDLKGLRQVSMNDI